MGQNGPKSTAKLKNNQEKCYSNNTARRKISLSEMDNVSIPSFQQGRDNLQQDKNLSQMSVNNTVDMHGYSNSCSLPINELALPRQPLDTKIENQSVSEFEHDINSKESVKFATKPQEHKWEQTPTLFPTSQQQSTKEYRQSVLLSSINSQEENGDTKCGEKFTTYSEENYYHQKPPMFSTSNSQGQLDDKQHVPPFSTQSSGQKDNKQSALCSISQFQGQRDKKNCVTFLATLPQEHTDKNQPTLSLETHLQHQKDEQNHSVGQIGSKPAIFSKTHIQDHNIVNQSQYLSTTQTLIYDNQPDFLSLNKSQENTNEKQHVTFFTGQPLVTSGLPQKSKKLDHPVVCSSNQLLESNKPVNKIITSGNPFFQSYPNEKRAEDIFNDFDKIVICQNQSNFSNVTKHKKSTIKDETVSEKLKHVEMIAESLTSDKNKPKGEIFKTEYIDSPSKARHGQQTLHNCIVKMRNVRDDNKELVLSLQKEITVHLREMELFTSVLKICPVVNANMYYLCENIKENLNALKNNYESTNTCVNSALISAPKLEFCDKFESENQMHCSLSGNQNNYVSQAILDNANLFVLSKDTEVNENKINIQANPTSLNSFMALLDQLPEYLAEEKQNISLKNTELYCRICERPIAFAFLNLKEHLLGKNHRALVNSSMAKKPTSSGSSTQGQAECSPVVNQEFEPVVKISLKPNHKEVLDLISNSVKEGFNFNVEVYICLLCDFFDNDCIKASSHVNQDHQSQQNAIWHFCETCLIHIYGTDLHLKEHCLTEQHITVARLRNESIVGEVAGERKDKDIASVSDEQDQESVCSSTKSDSSYRSRTKMTTHERLLSIVKTKKDKKIDGPFGLYCQLCKKYTKSLDFADHLNAQKHIQLYADLDIKRKKMMSLKKCLTCEVSLFGDGDVWREHQSLQIHKELLPKAAETRYQYELANRHEVSSFVTNEPGITDHCSSDSQSTEPNSIEPSCPENLAVIDSKPLSSFNEKGPHFDFMKTILKKHLEKNLINDFFGLYCHLCQLHFLDREKWELHLKSRSHKTKANSQDLVGRKIQYDCKECNVHLICEEQFYDLHLQSLAHKAISRIPAKRQQYDEVESEEDSSEDENCPESEDEDDENNTGNNSRPTMDSGQSNSSYVKTQEKESNTRLIRIPNGVYFNGLPRDFERKDVLNYFKGFGPLESLKYHRGSGSCIFKNKINATIVLQKKTIFIKGEPATVRPLMSRAQVNKEQYKLHPLVEHNLRSKETLAATVNGILSEMRQSYKHNQIKAMEITRELSMSKQGCRVLLFGSQVTGLATRESDFDIYIDYDGKSFYTDLSCEQQQNIIQHLRYQLTQQGSRFVVKEVILEARVPIIKVVHMKTNTLCDISCRSGLSVENSQLVRVYLELDPRVRWLVVIVKIWMRYNGLLDRTAFTSYATVWLVLFFLMQTPRPVVCPVVTLQKHCKPHTVAKWDCRFHRDVRDINKYFRSFNQQSELELLSAFFHYYASFRFKTTVLCPLNGLVLTRKQFENLTLPTEFRPYIDKLQYTESAEWLKIQTPICLQDPFDLSHNITKGVNRGDLDKFNALCHQSYKMCQHLLAA